MRATMTFLAAAVALATVPAARSANTACTAESGDSITPVIELFTSEGCSSCPPADRWLSSFRTEPGASSEPAAVVQAFHVGYWDYLGWIDRFANPAHTARQRQVAAWNGQRTIYTPQAVVNGRDGPAAGRPRDRREPASFKVGILRVGPDQFEAAVTARVGAPPGWSAYWTVTEDGHSSRVKAGENAGEFLKHDYVVRQYTEAGTYTTAPATVQKLTLRAIPRSAGHPRRINLVLFDGRSGNTLQAATLACAE